MKFRSIMSVAVLAASASFATDLMTTETVGWLKVDSTAVSTIISVPWVQVGTASGDVQVSKLVKTDELTPANGTVKLYYYDGTRYLGWALNTVNTVKTWVPMTVVGTVEGKPYQTPGDDYALPRGKALFIYRPDGTYNGSIYLYGKYSDTSPESFNTATGTSGSPAYTLIGNPTASNVSLNSGVLGNTNVGADDQLLIPNADGSIEKICTYKDGAWGWQNPKYTTILIAGKTIDKAGWDTNVSIPAGRGVWYVSKGGYAAVDF